MLGGLEFTSQLECSKMLNKNHLIILLLWYSSVQAWPKFTVTLLNLSYENTNDYSDFNVTLFPSGAITSYLRTLTEIKELFLTAVIKYSTDNSTNFDVDFMNKTINVCKLLQNRRYEPLLRLGYNIIAQKTHMPQRCPLQKNHLIYASNFIFETDQLPPVIPSTKVFVDVGLSTINNHQLYKFINVQLIAQSTHN